MAENVLNESERAFIWGIRHTTKIPLPVWQYKFDLQRKWRFDFAWPAERIAVEIEGGIWRRGGGAHSHPTNILRDIEKYNHAARLGWRIFRFTTDMVKNGEAIEFLRTIRLTGQTIMVSSSRIVPKYRNSRGTPRLP